LSRDKIQDPRPLKSGLGPWQFSDISPSGYQNFEYISLANSVAGTSAFLLGF